MRGDIKETIVIDRESQYLSKEYRIWEPIHFFVTLLIFINLK